MPLLRAAWRRTGGRLRYRSQAAAEDAFFAGCVDVHALPPIFHYWSNRYLRPMLEEFGFSHPDAFFAKYADPQYDIWKGGRSKAKRHTD